MFYIRWAGISLCHSTKRRLVRICHAGDLIGCIGGSASTQGTGFKSRQLPRSHSRRKDRRPISLARLQAATTSGKPVLLLYDTKAGHAGGRPLSKIIEDVSLEL